MDTLDNDIPKREREGGREGWIPLGMDAIGQTFLLSVSLLVSSPPAGMSTERERKPIYILDLTYLPQKINRRNERNKRYDPD